MTVRELLSHLIRIGEGLDTEVSVRLVRRDSENVVISEKLIPVSRVDANRNICIEGWSLDIAEEKSTTGYNEKAK